MKLIVIGRDRQEADIVLNSAHVSNYHAEIIQLDNGDMFLVDKSTNGTYLNGSRVTPGTEVSIRRGDSIMFADIPLDWSQIEDVVLPSGVKQIRSIGSHRTNDVVITGSGVSRFHATMRQMGDGKWYICDHSKNGTTVNGQKIVKNRYVQIKRGDKILCSGVPVSNPIKSKPVGPVVGICAGVLCLLACVFVGITVASSNKTYTDQELCEMYDNSIVFIACGYHFKVECGTLDVGSLPDPDSYNYKKDKYSAHLYDEVVFDKSAEPSEAFSPYFGSSTEIGGTGFFVGEQGYIATNRHVVKPWESERVSYSTTRETVLSFAEDYYRGKLNKLVEQGYMEILPYISQIKVTGVVDYILVIPNGEYLDTHSAYNCHEVLCSESQDEDLAIVKMRSNYLPTGAGYVPLDRIVKVEPVKGTHVLTMGYPFGLSRQDTQKTQLQADNSSGDISRNDNKYNFGFTAVSYHGASGSPVFDSNAYLVGVLNAGFSNSQGFNYAIRSEYLEKLLVAAGIEK